MRRRDFAFLVCAATMAPRALLAQATSKQFRVGSLWFGAKDAPLTVRYLGEVLTGMRELGYTEGQNLEMLDRFADSQADRLPQLARELVQLKPDVIDHAGVMDQPKDCEGAWPQNPAYCARQSRQDHRIKLRLRSRYAEGVK